MLGFRASRPATARVGGIASRPATARVGGIIGWAIAAVLLLPLASASMASAAPDDETLATPVVRAEGVAPRSGLRAEGPRPEAAQPGAFCLPGGCRPADASAWNAAAFAAALLAIRWRARRRPPAPA